MTAPRLLPVLTVLVLLTSACGSGADDFAEEGAAASSTTSLPTTATAAPTATAAAAITTTTNPTTSTSTTTAAAAPLASRPIPLTGVGDITTLVVEWAAGISEPLDLARRIIGFPMDIPVPAGSAPYELSVDLDGRDPAVWRWDWTYSVVLDEPLGDIDAELPEGGPGTIATMIAFDPVMTAFGWRSVAQVTSDPSSGAGGPQSVNFAYQTDEPTYRVGQVEVTPGVIRLWGDEDVTFEDSPLGDESGYRLDAAMTAPPNVILVPLLDSLVNELPVAPGARLTDLSFRTRARSEDSFSAAEGLRYWEIEFTLESLDGSADEARDIHSAGLVGTIYQVGEEDFFEPGFIRVVEATISGDTWTQPIIALNRYPGRITVTSDPTTGAVTSTVRITLEPSREILAKLPD